jgi:hypothetical protein
MERLCYELQAGEKRNTYCGRATRSRQKWMSRARHEKSPEVDGRDGKATMRTRTMLLLSSIPVSHKQIHFKSRTCCVFVGLTSD